MRVLFAHKAFGTRAHSSANGARIHLRAKEEGILRRDFCSVRVLLLLLALALDVARIALLGCDWRGRVAHVESPPEGVLFDDLFNAHPPQAVDEAGVALVLAVLTRVRHAERVLAVVYSIGIQHVFGNDIVLEQLLELCDLLRGGCVRERVAQLGVQLAHHRVYAGHRVLDTRYRCTYRRRCGSCGRSC